MKVTKEIPKMKETKAMIPTMQSSKKGSYNFNSWNPLVLTMRPCFKCGECWEKFSKYDLMKAHAHSGGQVKKTKEIPEVKITKEIPKWKQTKAKPEPR